MMRANFLLLLYGAVVVCLFFYSFTQIDLSLALTRFGSLHIIQQKFQYLGFFQRELSAQVFTAISVFLFLFYFIFLYLARKSKLDTKKVFITIIFSGLLLSFSYNAFSYDLFNYIFDAKIITHYGQNPFIHKALDFPGDPMLSFMRWTHRIYPYGPSWLGLTVPLSFLGAGFFLPTFFLFKILMGASYLGSSYLVYKISEKIFPQERIFNLIFFSLNPLILIEGLVSSHNDMPVIFFTLLSLWLLMNKRTVISGLSYVFSMGIKYSTITLLPVAGWLLYLKNKGQEIDWERVFAFLIIFSLLSSLIATIRTNFQPWYILGPLSFAAFISKKNYVLVPFVVLSVFGVLAYIPYVYLTDYHKDYPSVVSIIESAGFALAGVSVLVFVLLRNRFKIR